MPKYKATVFTEKGLTNNKENSDNWEYFLCINETEPANLI